MIEVKLTHTQLEILLNLEKNKTYKPPLWVTKNEAMRLVNSRAIIEDWISKGLLKEYKWKDSQAIRINTKELWELASNSQGYLHFNKVNFR